MQIEPGMAIIIGAALIFYLRLIMLQRERVKREAKLATPPVARRRTGKAPKTPEKLPERSVVQRYSVISRNPRNWAIAGCGAALVVVGLLLYANLWPDLPVRSYWWLPTAIGIVAFSWGFE